ASKLPGPVSSRPPRFDEHAFVVELRDARIANAVSYENISSGIPSDIGGPVEDVLLRALAWQSAAAASAATFGAASTTRRGHGNRFGLAAEHHHDATGRIKLVHRIRHLIDNPDVVLRIDADLLGKQHAVAVLSHLSNELSGPIELEQPRTAVRECPRRAERN